MGNIITAEIMKLKNDKMILISTLIVSLTPILVILKDSLQNTGVQRMGLVPWVHTMLMIVSILIIPIMSGFVITCLIQKEYGEQTIINTLTAPTSRTAFIIGKVIVWILWHITATIICVLITYVGCWLLFVDSFHIKEAIDIAILFLKCSIFNFISLMPVLCIAVIQKKGFYPSLLVCALFVGIQLGGINMPITLASALPWSAVTILSYSQTFNLYCSIAIFSLIICGLGSFMLSIHIFKHQNL